MDSTRFKFELIKAVKNRPALWNTTLTAFKDLNVKEHLWNEIAEDLNQPGNGFHFKIVYFIKSYQC